MKKLFYLDTRSLALFRIALGLVLLCDLWVRSQGLTAHYTDEGVMPRFLFEKLDGSTTSWIGPHFLSGSSTFQIFLFCLHGLFAVALIIGYQTQIALFLCWVFLLSLHDRNPLILNGGDLLFRMLLLWGLFLPLGHSWSWESRAPPKQVVGIPSIAFLLQLCLLYWISVIYKWNQDWLSGKAVGFALNVDQFTTSFGIWLREHPIFYKPLTYLTLGIEIGGPLLVWIPFKHGFYRTLGVFLMIFTHFCFNMGLELGMFSLICTAAWLAFLPSSFWSDADDLEKIVTGKILNGLAALLIVYVTIYNLSDALYPKSTWTALWVRPGAYLHLEQKWNMFSRPPRDGGWYAVAAQRSSGEQPIDLWREEEMSWTPPEPISSSFPNARWRKYMMNLWFRDYHRHRHFFVNYLIKKWETQHPGENITAAQMIYLSTNTSENFERSKEKKISLYRFSK